MKQEELLEAEIKNDNKVVAGWLLYYHERKQEYHNRREFLLHSTPRPEGNLGEGGISDNTGKKGVKLASMEETEQWLDLVEEVERRLPWKMQIYLVLRREYRYVKSKGPGRPAWMPHVQRRFAQELAKRIKKSEDRVWINSPGTFSEWWERILEYTARIAGKRGLL